MRLSKILNYLKKNFFFSVDFSEFSKFRQFLNVLGFYKPLFIKNSNKSDPPFLF